MMKNNLLWDTLQAVEQVEVAFEQTLKTIDHINHRYKLVSAFKRLASQRQHSYEAEIQAAITAPLTRSPPLYACTKISSAPQNSRRKKHRKRKNNTHQRTLEKPITQKVATPSSPSRCTSATRTLHQMDEEMAQNVVCLQANCIHDFEHQTQRIDRTKGNQSYRNRIRRLHEAAHKKLEQETREISNGRGKQMMQSDREPSDDWSDQDEELSTCDTHCSSSCSCQCEYF